MSRIKKVVVVYDHKDCGKTSVLCELASQLISKNQNATRILRRKGNKTELSSLPKDEATGLYTNDILFAIQIPQSTDGYKTVGIGSAGDDRDSVLRNFMFFGNIWPDSNFDVVFVAIREQYREDGLGDCEKSFPLMQLEEIERHDNLQVIRPFIRTGMKKSDGSLNQSGVQAKAKELEKMI